MSFRYVVAAAGVAALALTACSSSAKPSASAPTGSTGQPASGQVISAAGGVLVGKDGHTLYFNTVDTASSVKCVDACTKEWPPVGGPATAGGGVDSTKLGVATRPDGKIQATYNGHPLYEFDEDHQPGDRKGNGLADEGGSWHVAAFGASASVTEAPTTSPPVGSSSSSGGGYTY